jgi:hypothetical protein
VGTVNVFILFCDVLVKISPSKPQTQFKRSFLITSDEKNQISKENRSLNINFLSL